jgi:hypothetical protein
LEHVLGTELPRDALISPQDLQRWLQDLHVHISSQDALAYARALGAEGFDSADALSTLTDADLKSYGVKTGHRRVIVRRLKEIELQHQYDESANDETEIMAIGSPSGPTKIARSTARSTARSIARSTSTDKPEEVEKTKKAAEGQAKKEAEEKAKKETEEKAKKEAEEKARKQMEQEAKEAEEKAKEAKQQAKKEAEKKAKKEAEEQEERDASVQKLTIAEIAAARDQEIQIADMSEAHLQLQEEQLQQQQRANDPGDDIRVGYLWKRALQSGHNWRWRYLVMVGDTIAWFESEDAEKVRGSLSLMNAKVVVGLMQGGQLVLPPPAATGTGSSAGTGGGARSTTVSAALTHGQLPPPALPPPSLPPPSSTALKTGQLPPPPSQGGSTGGGRRGRQSYLAKNPVSGRQAQHFLHHQHHQLHQNTKFQAMQHKKQQHASPSTNHKKHHGSHRGLSNTSTGESSSRSSGSSAGRRSSPSTGRTSGSNVGLVRGISNRALSLWDRSAQEVANSEGFQHSFTILTPAGHLALCAPDAEQRQKWMNALQLQINRLKTSTKGYLRSSAGSWANVDGQRVQKLVLSGQNSKTSNSRWTQCFFVLSGQHLSAYQNDECSSPSPAACLELCSLFRDGAASQLHHAYSGLRLGKGLESVAGMVPPSRGLGYAAAGGGEAAVDHNMSLWVDERVEVGGNTENRYFALVDLAGTRTYLEAPDMAAKTMWLRAIRYRLHRLQYAAAAMRLHVTRHPYPQLMEAFMHVEANKQQERVTMRTFEQRKVGFLKVRVVERATEKEEDEQTGGENLFGGEEEDSDIGHFRSNGGAKEQMSLQSRWADDFFFVLSSNMLCVMSRTTVGAGITTMTTNEPGKAAIATAVRKNSTMSASTSAAGQRADAQAFAEKEARGQGPGPIHRFSAHAQDQQKSTNAKQKWKQLQNVVKHKGTEALVDALHTPHVSSFLAAEGTDAQHGACGTDAQRMAGACAVSAVKAAYPLTLACRVHKLHSRFAKVANEEGGDENPGKSASEVREVFPFMLYCPVHQPTHSGDLSYEPSIDETGVGVGVEMRLATLSHQSLSKNIQAFRSASSMSSRSLNTPLVTPLGRQPSMNSAARLSGRISAEVASNDKQQNIELRERLTQFYDERHSEENMTVDSHIEKLIKMYSNPSKLSVTGGAACIFPDLDAKHGTQCSQPDEVAAYVTREANASSSVPTSVAYHHHHLETARTASLFCKPSSSGFGRHSSGTATNISPAASLFPGVHQNPLHCSSSATQIRNEPAPKISRASIALGLGLGVGIGMCIGPCKLVHFAASSAAIRDSWIRAIQTAIDSSTRPKPETLPEAEVLEAARTQYPLPSPAPLPFGGDVTNMDDSKGNPRAKRFLGKGWSKGKTGHGGSSISPDLEHTVTVKLSQKRSLGLEFAQRGQWLVVTDNDQLSTEQQQKTADSLAYYATTARNTAGARGRTQTVAAANRATEAKQMSSVSVGAVLESVNGESVLLWPFEKVTAKLREWAPPLRLRFLLPPRCAGALHKHKHVASDDSGVGEVSSPSPQKLNSHGSGTHETSSVAGGILQSFNWQDREFSVVAGQLFCVNPKKRQKAGGLLEHQYQLRDCYVRLVPEPESHRPHCICLHPPHSQDELASLAGRTKKHGRELLLLQASSEEDQLRWAAALKYAIALESGGGYLLQGLIEKRQEELVDAHEAAAEAENAEDAEELCRRVEQLEAELAHTLHMYGLLPPSATIAQLPPGLHARGVEVADELENEIPEQQIVTRQRKQSSVRRTLEMEKWWWEWIGSQICIAALQQQQRQGQLLLTGPTPAPKAVPCPHGASGYLLWLETAHNVTAGTVGARLGGDHMARRWKRRYFVVQNDMVAVYKSEQHYHGSQWAEAGTSAHNTSGADGEGGGGGGGGGAMSHIRRKPARQVMLLTPRSMLLTSAPNRLRRLRAQSATVAQMSRDRSAGSTPSTSTPAAPPSAPAAGAGTNARALPPPRTPPPTPVPLPQGVPSAARFVLLLDGNWQHQAGKHRAAAAGAERGEVQLVAQSEEEAALWIEILRHRIDHFRVALARAQVEKAQIAVPAAPITSSTSARATPSPATATANAAEKGPHFRCGWLKTSRGRWAAVGVEGGEPEQHAVVTKANWQRMYYCLQPSLLCAYSSEVLCAQNRVPEMDISLISPITNRVGVVEKELWDEMGAQLAAVQGVPSHTKVGVFSPSWGMAIDVDVWGTSMASCELHSAVELNSNTENSVFSMRCAERRRRGELIYLLPEGSERESAPEKENWIKAIASCMRLCSHSYVDKPLQWTHWSSGTPISAGSAKPPPHSSSLAAFERVISWSGPTIQGMLRVRRAGKGHLPSSGAGWVDCFCVLVPEESSLRISHSVSAAAVEATFALHRYCSIRVIAVIPPATKSGAVQGNAETKCVLELAMPGAKGTCLQLCVTEDGNAAVVDAIRGHAGERVCVGGKSHQDGERQAEQASLIGGAASMPQAHLWLAALQKAIFVSALGPALTPSPTAWVLLRTAANSPSTITNIGFTGAAEHEYRKQSAVTHEAATESPLRGTFAEVHEDEHEVEHEEDEEEHEDHAQKRTGEDEDEDDAEERKGERNAAQIRRWSLTSTCSQTAGTSRSEGDAALSELGDILLQAAEAVSRRIEVEDHRISRQQLLVEDLPGLKQLAIPPVLVCGVASVSTDDQTPVRAHHSHFHLPFQIKRYGGATGEAEEAGGGRWLTGVLEGVNGLDVRLHPHQGLRRRFLRGSISGSSPRAGGTAFPADAGTAESALEDGGPPILLPVTLRVRQVAELRGTLWKQARHRRALQSVITSSWRSRYFVLRGGRLCWYTSEADYWEDRAMELRERTNTNINTTYAHINPEDDSRPHSDSVGTQQLNYCAHTNHIKDMILLEGATVCLALERDQPDDGSRPKNRHHCCLRVVRGADHLLIDCPEGEAQRLLWAAAILHSIELASANPLPRLTLGTPVHVSAGSAVQDADEAYATEAADATQKSSTVRALVRRVALSQMDGTRSGNGNEWVQLQSLVGDLGVLLRAQQEQLWWTLRDASRVSHLTKHEKPQPHPQTAQPAATGSGWVRQPAPLAHTAISGVLRLDKRSLVSIQPRTPARSAKTDDATGKGDDDDDDWGDVVDQDGVDYTGRGVLPRARKASASISAAVGRTASMAIRKLSLPNSGVSSAGASLSPEAQAQARVQELTKTLGGASWKGYFFVLQREVLLYYSTKYHPKTDALARVLAEDSVPDHLLQEAGLELEGGGSTTRRGSKQRTVMSSKQKGRIKGALRLAANTSIFAGSKGSFYIVSPGPVGLDNSGGCWGQWILRAPEGDEETMRYWLQAVRTTRTRACVFRCNSPP